MSYPPRINPSRPDDPIYLMRRPQVRFATSATTIIVQFGVVLALAASIGALVKHVWN
jgi:hypothetical protein